RPVPPREVLGPRARPAAQLRGRLLAHAGVILHPAIDILDGRAVRLVQGRFEDPTVYDDDPLAAAHSWVSQGARALHVIDLDGAPADALARLARDGVRTVVYTDVDRDGMLSGPDADGLASVLEAWSGRLVYSGGIGALGHLRALAALPLYGVIVGKALYEERFTLVEGQEALAQGSPH